MTEYIDIPILPQYNIACTYGSIAVNPHKTISQRIAPAGAERKLMKTSLINPSFLKKAAVVAMGVAMCLTMSVTSFAAVGTEGDSATRNGKADPLQGASSEVGTVTLGKILTVNQKKFPNVTDFNFEVTAVKAWDNSNVATGENGKAIAPTAMPMPKAKTDAHQTVTLNGTKAKVTVGNFKDDKATNKDAKNPESSTVKTRTNDLEFTFDKAGYYVYKVTETGSTPANVSGVTYDDHSYYIVFYVTNKQDEAGNTTDGVYVHNITSYRNASGKEDYKPDLSEIAVTSDGKVATDNTRDNLEKVGISTSEHPNKLAAYRFWNDSDTHDVVISKNVKGSLGDKTKEFEFTVALTGLEHSVTYTTNIATEEGQSTKGAKIISAAAGKVDTAAQTFTTDEQGNATFLVKMSDDEQIVLNALPRGSHYTVTEAESDHVASYALTSQKMDGNKAVANADAAIAGAAKANDTKGALATENETVDAADGTVTVAYTNTRDITPPTGVAGGMAFGAMALALVGAMVVFRRRKNGEISDMEM